MKRYLLFRGDRHNPAGGWDDFAGSFDTVEQAKEAAVEDLVPEWIQVVDSTNGSIVFEQGRGR